MDASARYNNPATRFSGESGDLVSDLGAHAAIYDGGLRHVALKDADSQIRQALYDLHAGGRR